MVHKYWTLPAQTLNLIAILTKPFDPFPTPFQFFITQNFYPLPSTWYPGYTNFPSICYRKGLRRSAWHAHLTSPTHSSKWPQLLSLLYYLYPSPLWPPHTPKRGPITPIHVPFAPPFILGINNHSVIQ